MTSPGPSSRIHSGAVTSINPRAGGTVTESQTSWPDDGKQQSHRLPLPPVTICNSSPFSHSNSAATSPSAPRCPGRAENPISPGSHWKKGKLLGIQHGAYPQNLPPHPFLLALASSANIGSLATPIGNPQNLVIAVQSNISFGEFLIGIISAMLMGVCVNALILLCMYWRLLSVQKDQKDVTQEVVADEDVNSHQFSPATMSHVTSIDSQEWNSRLESTNLQSSPNVNGYSGHIDVLRNRVSSAESEIQIVLSGALESARNSSPSKDVTVDASIQKREETSPSTRAVSMDRLKEAFSVQSYEENDTLTTRWRRILWKSRVHLVTLGIFISLLMGVNMSWTAVAAANALVVLDFKDAQPCLEKVSFSLLIFFCGMFITVDGFNKTGIPSTLWDLMEPYAKIDRASGIAVLALVILVLSNLASNVPTVLLLGGRVAASAAAISAADKKAAWLILAWVSTVGGNLSPT